MGEGISIRVLGRPGIVGRDGTVATIRGGTQTALLGMLTANLGRPLRVDVLVDQLWNGERGRANALRVAVRRLRDRFVEHTGDDPVLSDPAGYWIDLDPSEVDAGRYRAHHAAGVQAFAVGDLTRTLRTCGAATALWSGPPYDGLWDIDLVHAEQVRLDRLHLEVADLHAAALVLRGAHGQALDVLVGALADDPYRESALALRALAHHGAGRTGEASTALCQARTLLRDHLGADPGPLLVEVSAAVDAADAGRLRELTVRAALADDPAASTGVGASSAPLTVTSAATDARPLVGRDDELALLTAFTTSHDGAPPIADRTVVEGPAGIGKTRLGRAVADHARLVGCSVAWAACPRIPGSGLLVLDQVLEQIGGRAAASARDGDGRRARLAGPAERHSDLLAAQVRQATDVLASAPHPVVVIDDVHWITQDLAELLSYLVAATPQVTWLFLTRGVGHSVGAKALLADLARGGARWTELGPLAVADAHELVGQANPGLDAAGVDSVARRGSGHPLLLVELARHEATRVWPPDGPSGGGLSGDGLSGDGSSNVDSSALGESAEDESGDGVVRVVPRTVAAVVDAELDVLDDPARRLVTAVAVAATPHPVGCLAIASGISSADLPRAFAAAVASGIVATDDRRTRAWIAHDLFGAAVLDGLDGDTIARHHQRLAEALVDGAEDDDLAALRLHHLLHARTVDVDEADALALRAFASLDLHRAPHDVVALGRLLLERAPRTGTSVDGVRVRLMIASAHYSLDEVGEGERLRDDQRPTIERLGDASLAADTFLCDGMLRDNTTSAPARLDEGTRILEKLEDSEVERRIAVACQLGYLQLLTGNTMQARHLFGFVEEIMPTDPDPSAAALHAGLELQLAQTTDATASDIEKVLVRLETMVDARQVGDTALAMARCGRLHWAYRQGTLDDFDRILTTTHAELDDLPNATVWWWLDAAEIGRMIVAGDLAGAWDAHEAVLQGRRGPLAPTTFGIALLHRFLIDWDLGRLAGFHSLLPDGADSTTALRAARAVICLEAGDEAGAREATEDLRHATLDGGGPFEWPVLASLFAFVAWKLSDAQLAEQLLDPLDARRGEALDLVGLAYLGRVVRVQGLAAATLGDLDRAVDLLDAAVDEEVGMGSPVWTRRTALEAAEVRERRGGSDDAAAVERMRKVAADARARWIVPA